MKRIIAVLLTGIFCFSLSACVTRDANNLDRSNHETRTAQRDLNRVFNQ
jgi:starvation-inducible outer membrane lipoprotein